MAGGAVTTAPSILFLLFADELGLKRARWGGFTVPCSNTRVKTRALAETLIAVTIMARHDEGSMVLREVDSHDSWARRQELLIDIGRPTRYAHGLEVFEILGRGDALHVLRGICRTEATQEPAGLVLARTVWTAVQSGFYDDENGRRPRCERIVSVRNEFDAALRRWQEFTATSIGARLREEVGSAFGRIVPQPTVDRY